MIDVQKQCFMNFTTNFFALLASDITFLSGSERSICSHENNGWKNRFGTDFQIFGKPVFAESVKPV